MTEPALFAPPVLLSGGTVITMDPDRRVIEDGAVLVVDGRIVSVGERDAVEVEAAGLADAGGWRRCTDRADRLLSARKCVPGFVNTHTHLFQGLLKGPGDDRPLYRWLREMTVPAGTALTEEDCEAAAALGAVEAIRSGATTIVDFMYAHPRPFLADAVIRGLEPAGLRALVARGFVTHGEEHGMPAAFIEPLDRALADVARLRAAHASPGRLITIGVAPCLLWMVDERGLRATREFADATGALITYHMAETAFEVELSARLYGVAETEFLERIGFLGPDLLAVHCTKLDADADIARLRRHDVRVSHNPVSNMYLASGVAPIVAMDRAGLTIGLATDGPASNNNQNMLQVLQVRRSAAQGGARGRRGDDCATGAGDGDHRRARGHWGWIERSARWRSASAPTSQCSRSTARLSRRSTSPCRLSSTPRPGANVGRCSSMAGS